MKYRNMAILAFFLGATVTLKAQVSFDADFESGSIGNVTLVEESTVRSLSDGFVIPYLTYSIETHSDPLNPVDTDIEPSARWFYFRMIGTKGKFIDIKLNNTDPLRAVYSYDNKTFLRFREDEATRGEIMKFFDHDTVYVAYFTPYTNSYLQKRILQWKQHKDVAVRTFGYSTNGLPMQLLTITDRSISEKQKKRIWIHARTHTSETPCSWHLDGLIDALLYSKTGEACRQNCIFYIVPFTNPDGVVEGLSRSNATGVNQEVNWDRADSLTVAEVQCLKWMIGKLTADKPFDMALNLHSQASENATMFVHSAQTTNTNFFRREMLLAYLNMLGDSSYLTPSELSFSDLAPRYPEGWFWNISGDHTLAITIETPYSYFGENHIWASTESLRGFGNITLQAIAAYFSISSEDRVILENETAKLRGKWDRGSADDVLFLGNDYLQAQQIGKKITYRSLDKLPAGTYRICRWNAASINDNRNKSNRLTILETRILKKAKKLKYTLKSKQIGEIFDALILIKEE